LAGTYYTELNLASPNACVDIVFFLYILSQVCVRVLVLSLLPSSFISRDRQ
jgi:hypothetical protein